MYYHAKFHADRCHRRRDICNRTEKITAINLVPCHNNARRVIKRKTAVRGTTSLPAPELEQCGLYLKEIGLFCLTVGQNQGTTNKPESVAPKTIPVRRLLPDAGGPNRPNTVYKIGYRIWIIYYCIFCTGSDSVMLEMVLSTAHSTLVSSCMSVDVHLYENRGE